MKTNNLSGVELVALDAADVQLLDPELLAAVTMQAADDLIREGESSNTLASYRGALRYWAAWYQLRFGHPLSLPLPVNVVVQFVVDHAARTTAAGLRHELPAEIDQILVQHKIKGKPGPMKLTTLLHRLAVISKAHQLQELDNPCQDGKVKELVARTRRAYGKRGDIAEKKDALTKEPLLAMLETCDDSLIGLRDRALLLFAWSTGGHRRSEVASASMKFLKRVTGGAFVYTLTHSKSNQAANDRPENRKPIQGPASEALQNWLEKSGIREGAIFRRVLKNGRLGESLSPTSVRNIVRQRAQLAGLPDDFSAHSLRSGFVTEAANQNIPLPDTMALTGHRSVSSVLGYFRATTNSKAANLL